MEILGRQRLQRLLPSPPWSNLAPSTPIITLFILMTPLARNGISGLRYQMEFGNEIKKDPPQNTRKS
jgi:hypothetical protein